MTVWIRIALYMLAGWLYGSGYIGDEVRSIVTNDPAIAGAIEAGVSALIASVSVLWWRVAKRLGWDT